MITIDGWVTGIGDHEASFWVRASDEQEIVCEGEIHFAIVKRAQMERKIQRKCEAIGRRGAIRRQLESYAGNPYIKPSQEFKRRSAEACVPPSPCLQSA